MQKVPKLFPSDWWEEREREGGREENGSSFPMMILVYNRRAGSGVAVHTASYLNVSVFG